MNSEERPGRRAKPGVCDCAPQPGAGESVSEGDREGSLRMGFDTCSASLHPCSRAARRSSLESWESWVRWASVPSTVHSAGVQAGSCRERGRRLESADRRWLQFSIGAGTGLGAHPGGAVPGGDLGDEVAQPVLQGHHLIAAPQSLAPACHSCLAGGCWLVEGLTGCELRAQVLASAANAN